MLRLSRWIVRSGDCLLLVRLLLFAASVPLLMRLNLSHLEYLLTPRGVDPTLVRRNPQSLAWYVDRVIRLGAPIIRRGCLTRGVTLYYFLTRAGVDVRLCFGIGWIDQAVVGHCWLTRDGEPFLEARDPYADFQVMHVIQSGVSSAY